MAQPDPSSTSAAEDQFTVSYDGPAVHTNRMEVRQLAPALLALADLFSEANTIVSPELPPVSLHIRATRRGSFDVGLSIIQVAAAARDLLISQPVTALTHLTELILAPRGLFDAVRALGNRHPDSIEHVSGNTVRITAGDATLEYPLEVAQLYGNVSLRNSTRQVVEPLEREGIDQVSFRRDVSHESLITLNKDDLPAFEPPEALEDPATSETSMTLLLRIVTANLQAERYKWRFSDGEQVFTADIEDQHFQEQVRRGDIVFRNGDALRCQLRVKQWQLPTGALRSEKAVVKVMEYIRGPDPPATLFNEI